VLLSVVTTQLLKLILLSLAGTSFSFVLKQSLSFSLVANCLSDRLSVLLV
jgi:hypothetical protein